MVIYSALVTPFWWSLGERYKEFKASFAPRGRQVYTHLRGVYDSFVSDRDVYKRQFYTSMAIINLQVKATCPKHSHRYVVFVTIEVVTHFGSYVVTLLV